MSIPSNENIGLWHFGYALVKALLLAKFILLGHMFHIGEREHGRPLIYSSLISFGAGAVAGSLS